MRLLHLTDLHFTSRDKMRVQLGALLADLKKLPNAGSVDIVLVTGDFSDKGNKDGFEAAGEFLSCLSDKLSISRENILLVPGNHDVDYSLGFVTGTDSKGNSVEIVSTAEYLDRFAKFSDYIYRPISGKDYPKAAPEQAEIRTFSKNHMQFLLLNSCHEIDSRNPERSSICMEALMGALEQLDYEAPHQEAKTGDLGLPIRICVFHHPVRGYRPVGGRAIANGEIVLQHLLNANFSLCLHGDIHEMTNDLIYSSHDAAERKIHILGTGSFGCNRKDIPEASNRMYTLLDFDIESGTVVVHTRCQPRSDGPFEPLRLWIDERNPDAALGSFQVNLNSRRKQTIGKPSKYEEVKRELESRLNKTLKQFAGQPTIWTDRLLTTESEALSRPGKDTVTVEVSHLLSDVRDRAIQAPPQFGLTSLSHYLVKLAWVQNEQSWIYIDFSQTKLSELEKIIEEQFEFFDTDASQISCVVIDSIRDFDKATERFLKKLFKLVGGTPVLLMVTSDGHKFGSALRIGVEDRQFEMLYLRTLRRAAIRNLVSEYISEKGMDDVDEETLIRKLSTDMEVLNIHRTPSNCLTLLKAMEAKFEDNPVNRSALLNQVLYILFNVDEIPSYKSRPDLKDCEYVLGYFCEQLIRNSRFQFSRTEFLTLVNSFCDAHMLELEVDVLLDILYKNSIIVDTQTSLCFRFSYWIYYFASLRMLRNDEFHKYIMEETRYAEYPEIIEFYTGADRSRNDVLRQLRTDLHKAIDDSASKCGLTDGKRIFKLLSWTPSPETVDALQAQLQENINNSNLPTSIKDEFRDLSYDPSKPYNQDARRLVSDSTFLRMTFLLSASARALRNSDYAEPALKSELLNEITRGWEQVLNVLIIVLPILAKEKQALFEDTQFILIGDSSDSPQERFVGILSAIPNCIMNWFNEDLRSPRVGKLIGHTMQVESDEFRKNQLVLLHILHRPKDWRHSVEKYIQETPKNSFFLLKVLSLLRNEYKYGYLEKGEKSDLEYLIKMTVAKHSGSKNPGKKAVRRIPDDVLPSRDEGELEDG